MMNDKEAFAFHWDGGGAPWEHLRVVELHVEDAISAPYRIRLRLHARSADDAVDPFDLIGASATLRIATGDTPAYRALHGIIVEAEEIGLSQHGVLYELTLAPPFARASHRQRSRVFLEKSLREVIEAVLKGDPRLRAEDPPREAPSDLRDDYVPAKECYTFRLGDPSRIDDPTLRPYCVQYQESDLDFISRLLEEEGIGYHFEHSHDAVTLVFADVDQGRAPLEPYEPLSPSVAGRHLDGLRLGGRLRPTAVRTLSYNWQKPKLDMSAEAKGDAEELAIETYVGRYADSPSQGAPTAKAILERYATEARIATARGSCRLLSAGTVFAYSHPASRYEGHYLVTRVEMFGHARGEALGAEAAAFAKGALDDTKDFVAMVELARCGAGPTADDSKFRPARSTPRPLISGTQTAVVTDEPFSRGAEIHVGGPEGNENGCVRLKFHWDTETGRHEVEPTSCWVRVSQSFAGAGGGGVFHPRVGTEVIVAYEDGDPDRPLVVGRLYNGIQKPPATGKGAATVSTLKSLASPGGAVFNELAFDDTAGSEQVNLNAGKDWNSTVGNDRNETVTTHSTSKVGVDRTEDTGSNRTTTVGANNTESVTGSEKISITGRQNLTITSGQDQTVTADRNLTVTGPHTVVVGPESYTVNGAQTETINGAQTVTVNGGRTDTVTASQSLSVGAALVVSAGAGYTLTTPTATTSAPLINENAAVFSVSASAVAQITTAEFKAISSGAATVQGATVAISGDGDVVISGGSIKIKGGDISLEGGSITIAGGTVDISGSVVKVN